MNLEGLYEETYVMLEAQGWNCQHCGKGPRLHNINVVPMKDGTHNVQSVCRYGSDGRLKEVFRRAAGADKEALRETFGRIYLEERGQCLKDFLKSLEALRKNALREIGEARSLATKTDAYVRSLAEKLGVAIESRGKPHGTNHLFEQVILAIDHIRARAEADQKSALEFYGSNTALAKTTRDLERRNASLTQRVTQQEAEIAQLHGRLASQGTQPATVKQTPQLRVVGTPPAIPSTTGTIPRKA